MAPLIYLHGFASGPDGHKGRHCRAWAERHGVAFHAPDLNVPSFEHLTIGAQVTVLEDLLGRLDAPPVVVGSSLGGLVAAAAAARGRAMAHLILLAPAFGFARRRLGGPRWAGYRQRGTLRVFHHAIGAWTRLGPALLQDLAAWNDDAAWIVPVPTLIIHGTQDDSVPIDESRAFASRQPECRLLEVPDDHGLLAPDTLRVLDEALRSAVG